MKTGTQTVTSHVKRTAISVSFTMSGYGAAVQTGNLLKPPFFVRSAKADWHCGRDKAAMLPTLSIMNETKSLFHRDSGPMNLSRFIEQHVQEILAGWETFARTMTPASDGMSIDDLRNHAESMLYDMVRDIDSPQSAQQQAQKSTDTLSPAHAGKSAAAMHGVGRQARNFTLLQVTAEYRALRASVLRLWLPHVIDMDEDTVNQLMRFNEAVDQALAESVVAFSASTDYTRDLFLAILGHDLRTPLSTMAMTGELLMQPDAEYKQPAQLGARVKRSASFMNSMINNLLDYARKHLGSGIPVKTEPADLRQICQVAIDEASTLYPDHRYQAVYDGELAGYFDRVQVQQLLNNLLCNAGQYGAKESPVTLSAKAEGERLIVRVHNRGHAIPEESLQSIFAPLIQLPTSNEIDGRPRTSLGLGLYIAREIAEAHNGEISVTSNDRDGTTFTVGLPRGEAPR